MHAAAAVDRFVAALNAADPVAVQAASTEASWATKADGARRLYKAVATSALEVTSFGRPQERGDRAVGRVSLWWPAQNRHAGAPWLLLVRGPDGWRVDGVRKDPTYAALFLEGRLPGLLSSHDLPHSADGVAWGQAEVGRLLVGALRAPDQVVDVWPAPQLARIPDKADPGFEAAHRELRERLRDAAVIAVTSSRSGEGKTTTAMELARGLAADGKRVLLADLDLRMPKVHRRLGLLAGPGVVGATEGVAIDRAVQRAEGLDVLVAGRVPHDPPPFLKSYALRRLMSDARAAYDVVVVDLATAVQYDDAFLALGAIEGHISTVVVVELGRTTAADLRRARTRFSEQGRNVAGLVLNRTASVPDEDAKLARVEVFRAVEVPEVSRIAVGLHTWREGDARPRERWTILQRGPSGLSVVDVGLVLTLEALLKGLVTEPLELAFDHPAQRAADEAARNVARLLGKALDPDRES